MWVRMKRKGSSVRVMVKLKGLGWVMVGAEWVGGKAGAERGVNGRERCEKSG
jgi:hypothetical protein